MFTIIRIRKLLFGERFAAFTFGFDTVIRKIRYDADGGEYCYAYGTLIESGTRGWREI